MGWENVLVKLNSEHVETEHYIDMTNSQTGAHTHTHSHTRTTPQITKQPTTKSSKSIRLTNFRLDETERNRYKDKRGQQITMK